MGRSPPSGPKPLKNEMCKNSHQVIQCCYEKLFTHFTQTIISLSTKYDVIP